MRVPPGSDKYFTANADELADIKKIATGKKYWIQKKASKMMNKIRKVIYGKDTLQAEFKSRREKAQKSIIEDNYTTKIDSYVNSRVDGYKTGAFTKFKSGLNEFNTIAAQFSGYAEELKAHPELNNALNHIQGEKKTDACKALSALASILNAIDTSTNSPFLLLVKQLHGLLANENSETKKYLDENLTDITDAMEWDWTKAQSTAKLEKFLDDDQKKETELIRELKDWAAKMKGQQSSLISALPKENEYNLKFHGYFIEQIDKVKKVAKQQLNKDLTSQKKLDTSLMNFLADKIKGELGAAQKALEDSKGPLDQSKAAIKECLKEIAKLESKLNVVWWSKAVDTDKYKTRQSNLQVKEQDRKDIKSINKVLRSEWKSSFQDVQSRLDKDKKALTNRAGKKTKDQIVELLDLLKDLRKLSQDIDAMKTIYKAKIEWDLIYLDRKKSAKLGDDANSAECLEIKTDCDLYIAKIKSLLEDIESIPQAYRDNVKFQNFFGSEDEITFSTAKGKLNELLGELKEEQTAARNRSSDLSELTRLLKLAKLAPPVKKHEPSELDNLKLEELSNNFDLDKTSPSFLFDELVSGLRDLSDAQLGKYKKYKATHILMGMELRHGLYEYILSEPEKYKEMIAERIQNDISGYMGEATARLTPLMLAMPGLQLKYQAYRREYQEVKDDTEKVAKLEGRIQEDSMTDEVFKMYCMTPGFKSDSFIELKAVKEMFKVRLDIQSCGEKDKRDQQLMEGDEHLPIIHLYRYQSGDYTLLKKKVAG